MKLWAVVEHQQPLQCIEVADPEPAGTEVVIAVTHCGVCHSDLHFWKGSYNMGGGKTLTIADRGVTLPRAPGHEVVGRVVAKGPEASGVEIGDLRIVYPWLGCGRCFRCREGDDNMCDSPSAIGVIRHGGFGSHVVAPHPRYLVDYGDVDPAVAATFACSGVTVYSAIRKLGSLDPDRPVVLIGAGGLGLAAIGMLRALGHRSIISIDTSERKREAAAAAGATATIDGAAGDLAEAVMRAADGPALAVLDFVNSTSTANSALGFLGKGGKLVLVGVAGGDMTLSLAGMVFRAHSVQGSNTGTVRDLIAVAELAKAGKLPPLPVQRMPQDSANEALRRLAAGEVIGRIVLETT